MRQEAQRSNPTVRGAAWTSILLAFSGFSWLTTSPVWGKTHCVGTAVELQAALDEASGNWTNDYVLVQRGTYRGNFQFGSQQHWPVTIRGGYDQSCTSRVDDPSSTILDAEGSGTVLSFYQHAGGGVHVEGLTLRNGGYHGLWIRLINEFGDNTIEGIQLVNNVIESTRGKTGVYMMSEPDQAAADPIRIYDNIITGNMGELGGIQVVAQWRYLESFIVFHGNLVVGNIGTSSTGGVSISSYDRGTIYLTNNTIAQNENRASIGIPGGLNVGVGTALYAYNNIVRDNLSANGVDDLSVHYYQATSTGAGFNNDYSEMGGSWKEEGGNQNVDPAFVRWGRWWDQGTPRQPFDDVWIAGDYHLLPDSPCIDAGWNDIPAPGTPPAHDFEGDPRIVDGNGNHLATVDIGADESVMIFIDGFESGDLSAWSEF